MIQENKLKIKIEQNKFVLGPFLKISDPAVTEIAGFAGFDFVIIDTEHGPLSIERSQDLVRAAELAGITPVIRVPENNEHQILRALDIGAHAVQVPQISTPTDAIRAGRSVKFSPNGERGVCRYVRAAGYSSMNKDEYFKTSNKEVMLIAHIEGNEGINNLDRILDTKTIDIIFIGPYDLSASCHLTGQVNHPEVISKMKEVVDKCKKANVLVGTFVDNEDSARQWLDAGVHYIAFSVDVGILYQAFKLINTNIR